MQELEHTPFSLPRQGAIYLLISLAITTTVACSPPPSSNDEQRTVAETPTSEPGDTRATPQIGFPVLPPVDDADPLSRRPRKVQVPTRLKIERTDSRIGVQVDPESAQTESLLVGANMIVGYSWKKDVISDGRVIRSGGRGLSGSVNSGWIYFNREADGFPVPGEEYEIEFRMAIFETDIPPQHLWSPESGKYKVLLNRTIRQKVE